MVNKSDIGGAGKWQFFGFGFGFFKKKIVFVFSQWKSPWLLYEVSFISALGMVSSESWKKDFISTNMHTTIAVAQINC